MRIVGALPLVEMNQAINSLVVEDKAPVAKLWDPVSGDKVCLSEL